MLNFQIKNANIRIEPPAAAATNTKEEPPESPYYGVYYTSF